jgi:uncharacterized membrane protein
MISPRGLSDGLVRASVVLGVGIGGFFDGIVFHQILQWHHMISGSTRADTVPNLELNILVDGLFHATTWVITVIGIWLVFRALVARRPGRGGRLLAAGLLGGWGAFNVVEGLVDHYLLGIHHVRPGADAAIYDALFLLWGAAFIAVAWWLIRSEGRLPRSPST